MWIVTRALRQASAVFVQRRVPQCDLRTGDFKESALSACFQFLDFAFIDRDHELQNINAPLQNLVRLLQNPLRVLAAGTGTATYVVGTEESHWNS